MQSDAPPEAQWPALQFESWKDTLATLHMWTQIAGKNRFTQSPWINHSWQATFYVTSRGITTSPIPHQARTFEIVFDFIAHQLVITSSDGQTAGFALTPQSVATFYNNLSGELKRLGLFAEIHKKPNEVADPIRFDQDEVHRSYDSQAAHRFWQILVQVDRVMKEFRGRFIGKCSPVHLFWGALDLAVTRFSGRKAPRHPGGVPNLPDAITREAYSQEVSSCGFWPGSAGSPVPYPAFYSYAYPQPAGFGEALVKPAQAFYQPDLGEFILPYDVVRTSPSPDQTLLEFLESTYEAAATLATWDRAALEHQQE